MAFTAQRFFIDEYLANITNRSTMLKSAGIVAKA